MGIGEQFEFEKTGRIEPECGMNERAHGVPGEPKTTKEFIDGLEQACRSMSRKNRALEAEIERLRAALSQAIDLVDDVIYNPYSRPVDENGDPITGDARYLLDVPIMPEHLPALREWFVEQCKAGEAAGGA